MEVATRDHHEQDIEEAVPGSTSDREPLLLALPAFTPSFSPSSSLATSSSSRSNTVPPEAWPGGTKAFYSWHALNLGYGLYLVAIAASLAVGLVANGGASCQRRLTVWAALELGFCALGLFNVLWKHRRVPQLVVDRNAASSTDDVFISASRLTLTDVGAIYGGMFLNAGWVVWLIFGCIWTWGGSDGAEAETCAPVLLATCSLVLKAHLAVVGLLVAGLVGVVSVLPVLHFVRPDLFAPPSRGATKALIERTTRRSTFQPRGPADDLEQQQQVNHEDGVDQKRNNTKEEEQEDTSCAICLSDYVAGEQVRELGCGHVFHASCVDAWLETNKTCAACRRPIDQQQQQQEETSGGDDPVIYA